LFDPPFFFLESLVHSLQMKLSNSICSVILVCSSALVTAVQLTFDEDPRALAKNDNKKKGSRERAAADQGGQISSSAVTALILKNPIIARTQEEEGILLQRRSSFDLSRLPRNRILRERLLSVDVGSFKDTVSEVSSADGTPSSLASSRSKIFATEELCGNLHKQGDFLGIWKQRFFRLAALEQNELGAVEGLAQEYKQPSKRLYLLFYWTCEAHVAMSENHRNIPKGAFALESCTVRMGQDSAANATTFHVEGLVDAFDPDNDVPTFALRANDRRTAHRWITGLLSAGIASTCPKHNCDRTRGSIPIADLSDDLVVITHPASGQALTKNFFRLYLAHESAQAADLEDDEYELPSRVFLLSWLSEKSAISKPLTAKNMYDLSKAKAVVNDAAPEMIVIRNAEDLHVFNQFPCQNGTLVLKARNAQEACIWARAIDESCKIDEEGFSSFGGSPEPFDELLKEIDAPGTIETNRENVDNVEEEDEDEEEANRGMMATLLQSLSFSSNDSSLSWKQGRLLSPVEEERPSTTFLSGKFL